MSSSLRSLRLVSRCVAPRRAITSSLSTRAFAAPQILTSASRAFSVSARASSSGETDLSLTQKLQEELKFEQEAASEDAFTAAFLDTFKQDGVWKIEDTAGHDEVALVRDFGNENIRLLFSIADIDSPTETFEEGVEGAEGEEGEAPEPNAEVTYPLRTSITITKTGNGALSIDANIQDGAFTVDNISFYSEEKLATDLTAESDWKRRGLYIGPQFDHLDVTVQELFEQYLEERGINASLALFIPEYAEYKEQKEYVKWLGKVKTFVQL